MTSPETTFPKRTFAISWQRVKSPICVKRPVLVILSDFFAKITISIGLIFPDAFPKEIKIPKSFNQLKESSKVVLPTESITTGTPIPFVSFMTSSEKLFVE